jgi:hypothetical protein
VPPDSAPTPGFELVARLAVDVAPPIATGESARGTRRLVPILGGRALGPRITGRVLPGGADFQLLRSDGVTEVEARYVIETEDGAHVYVRNRGLRHGPREAIERLNRGDPVDPAAIYFRSTVAFETGAPALAWLMRDVFVGTGARFPDRVELAWYRVT